MTDLSAREAIKIKIKYEGIFINCLHRESSVSHKFPLTALEKYGLHQDFLKRITFLLKNQESCVKSWGKTSRYFSLNKCTQQGHPISDYVFILVLEIAFLLIKAKRKVEGLKLICHNFSYRAYADNTTSS